MINANKKSGCGTICSTLRASWHRSRVHTIKLSLAVPLQYDCWRVDNSEVLSAFCQFYDRFAASRRLPTADWNRLYALAISGFLDLSRVCDEQGTVLVWHAHYHAAHRARLLHSASLRRPSTEPALRAAIGRANCYLTWQDMLRFQRQGVRVYDLGGWYAGTKDKGKLGINRFKASFGGVIVREFNAEHCVTAIGRVALVLLRSYRYCARMFGAACDAIVRLPAILARSKRPSLISSHTPIQHCGGPSPGLAAPAKPSFTFHDIIQDGVDIIKVSGRVLRAIIESASPDEKDLETLRIYVGGSPPNDKNQLACAAIMKPMGGRDGISMGAADRCSDQELRLPCNWGGDYSAAGSPCEDSGAWPASPRERPPTPRTGASVTTLPNTSQRR